MPADKVLVENVAAPLLSSFKVDRTVAPSVSVTLPVGIDGAPPTPVDEAATWAVNTTDCPNADGFGAEPRVTVVEFLLTVWDSRFEEEELKLGVPA